MKRARRDQIDRRDLPGDLFAGLTLWAVFAAQALAYARLAHATPTAGLVTALAGAGLYTLFGTSRRISIGPAGGIAAMVGALPALAAGAAVVTLGMIRGVVVGIVVALVEALRRAMYPNRSVFSRRLGPGRLFEPFTADAVHASGDVLIYRFGAGLFFGNADAFRDDMTAIVRAANGAPRTVIVDCDTLGIPDATAHEMLQRAQRELRDHGITLLFGNAREPLRRALAKAGSFTLIDEARFVGELVRHHPLAGGPGGINVEGRRREP